jgi:hypothetical protein
MFTTAAYASHPEVSLPGSNFEIDTDANLKVDDAGSLDWANVTEVRKQDTTSGPTDESFGNGTKEDTASPTVVNGSIPPNKSDLKFFGVYQEGNTSSGFLNLFWSRVQEPVGTTNMDFEFNKRQCTPNQTPADADCTANGITPIRSTGDLLITYDLSQGGTVPTISIRTWNGSSWGPATSLTTPPIKAAGSINTSPIPAADADGLGNQSARTFGEAQIALSAIFDPTKCESFGSAYLKSRASDQFNAALKDFVPPAAINISNCGRVVVKKTDEGGTPLAGASFTINPANSATPPSSSLTEVATGVFCIDFLLLGTQYTVHESVAPPGYDPAPDQTFTPTQTGGCGDVTGSTPPDLTFVDVAQRGAISITKTAKHADTSGDTSPNLVAGFTITGPSGPITVSTDASGKACVDNLSFGAYTVTESTVPAGYSGDTPKTTTVDNKASCADSTYVGESVSFVNTPLTDLTVSVDSQVPGGTNSTITCDGEEFTTDTNGDGSLTLNDLPPGTYDCTIVVDP